MGLVEIFCGKIHCQKFPASSNCKFVSGKGKMKGRKYNHICWVNHILNASFWSNKQMWNDRLIQKTLSWSWQQEIYVLALALSLTDLGFTFQHFDFHIPYMSCLYNL